MQLTAHSMTALALALASSGCEASRARLLSAPSDVAPVGPAPEHAGPVQQARVDTAPRARELPRAPLRVSLTAKSSTPSYVVLTARIERLAPIQVPLQVTIDLPARVALERGLQSETIPAAQDAGVIERELAFRVAGVPAGDIVLNVRAEGEGFGMHGKDTYTFGRPRAEPRPPQRDGPPLKIGGRDFGRSVRLEP